MGPHHTCQCAPSYSGCALAPCPPVPPIPTPYAARRTQSAVPSPPYATVTVRYSPHEYVWALPCGCFQQARQAALQQAVRRPGALLRTAYGTEQAQMYGSVHQNGVQTRKDEHGGW